MVGILLLIIFVPSLTWAQSSEGFQNITGETGIAENDSTTVVFGDFNRDGWVDLIANGRLYRNITKDKIHFKDVTMEAGLQSLKGNPAFIDLNGDQRADIMTTAGQVFLQDAKGKFTESAAALKLALPENIHALSFVDYNNDGWVDIFASQRETHNAEQTEFYQLPVKVFKNVKGRSFVDASSEFGFSKSPSYTRSMVWADHDENGWPDGYFANYRLKPSFFLKNDQGRLEDIGKWNGTAGPYDPERYYDRYLNLYGGPVYGHAIGALWADLNNDGSWDLWVSKLAHKAARADDFRGYVCDDSKIYRNTGAPDFAMVDMRAKSGIPVFPITRSNPATEENWAHVTAADYDNDGWTDVYVTQVYDLEYAYSHLFRNLGDFKFKDESLNFRVYTHDTYAAGWADLDNDGRMDLVVGGIVFKTPHRRLRIFRNVIDNGHHFLRVRLEGTKSGTNPITAKVILHTENGLQLRQYEGVVGTLNQQNDPTIHFGLGKLTEIEKLEVVWPSGVRQTIKDPKVDSTLMVVEPK